MPREYIRRVDVIKRIEQWWPRDILAPMATDDLWRAMQRMVEDRDRDVFDEILKDFVRRVKSGLVRHLS